MQGTGLQDVLASAWLLLSSRASDTCERME